MVGIQKAPKTREALLNIPFPQVPLKHHMGSSNRTLCKGFEWAGYQWQLSGTSRASKPRSQRELCSLRAVGNTRRKCTSMGMTSSQG